jgi:2-iminobutanoate/2-iminopropanoate deaminase
VTSTVFSPDAPIPNGHYSQTVSVSNMIFTSLILPIQENVPDSLMASVEQQVEVLLNNISAIVEAGGSSLLNIFKITFYITDIKYWTLVNEVFAKQMFDHKPARGVIVVKEIHLGFKVAADAIAIIKQ